MLTIRRSGNRSAGRWPAGAPSARRRRQAAGAPAGWQPALRIASLAALVLLAAAAAPKRDWKHVEAALGRAGSMQPGDVYKVGFPRGDLTVTLDGVTIKPAL